MVYFSFLLKEHQDRSSLLVSIACYFFFQAEDGIRDGHVTGVQTCALPICWDRTAAPCCAVKSILKCAATSSPGGAAARNPGWTGPTPGFWTNHRWRLHCAAGAWTPPVRKASRRMSSSTTPPWPASSNSGRKTKTSWRKSAAWASTARKPMVQPFLKYWPKAGAGTPDRSAGRQSEKDHQRRKQHQENEDAGGNRQQHRQRAAHDVGPQRIGLPAFTRLAPRFARFFLTLVLVVVPQLRSSERRVGA